MKKILSILFFILIGLSVFSQTKYFTDSLYLKQMYTLLSPVFKTHLKVETEYNELKKNWEKGFINDMKLGIVDVSNSMKEENISAYPYFYYYLATLNTLIEKQDLDFYRQWEVEFAKLLLTKKKKSIYVFLRSSKLLINDSIIAQNNIFTWKIKAANFVIGNKPKTQTLYVDFNSDFDLFCFNTNGKIKDTIEIKKTSGTFYPVKNFFRGNYGRIVWNFKDISYGKIFAEFSKYQLDLSKGKFEIDSVFFTDKYLDLHKVSGILRAKLAYNNSKKESPVFVSDSALLIKNIFPEVDFFGKIKMRGEKLFGIGKNKKALLFIRNKGKNIATIKSNSFDLNKNKRIYSGSAAIAFYLNNNLDSIYHDNVEIRYLSKLNKNLFKAGWIHYDSSAHDFLVVTRENKTDWPSPMTDSYHKFDIYSDKLVWVKGDSLLYFITSYGSDNDFLALQSVNFFDKNVYDYFAGVKTDKVNHLAEIKSLYNSLSKNNEPLTVRLYQEQLKKSRNQQLPANTVQQLFQKLSYSNFVIYNRDDNTIKPTKKLYTYLSNFARLRLHKKKFADFDRLMIVSMRGKPGLRGSNVGVNAILNLRNDDLVVNNVKNFWLSSNVKVMAKNITIKKDRQITFAGEVGAGLIDFRDSKFLYDYEKNTIKTDTGAQVNFGYIDTLSNGKLAYFPISTQMTDISGTLFINPVNDKSNTLGIIEYPKFVCNRNPKIYYSNFEKKYSLGKTESKHKKFYFDAKKFTLDSLRYLTKDDLEFKGIIHTNLFRPLPVTYTVKQGIKKNYLGFEECTKSNKDLKNGLKFKGGKFYGCFLLSDDGLFGKGYISYFSANIYSQKFVFLPNRVYAQIDSIFINKNKSINPSVKEDIPLVVGKNLEFNWTDKMRLFSNPKSDDDSISIYSDKLDRKAVLNGSIVYEPNKMKGKGRFIFEDAELVDTNFDFKENSFDAHHCDFNLKLQKSSVFVTKNLNGHVDIIKQMGTFYSNDDTTRILFKDNDYVCIMDHFLWKIGKGIVNIGGVMPGKDSSDYVNSVEEKIKRKKDNKQIKLFGTVLVNTDDTLRFNAAATTYDINNKTLIAHNVQQLKISDALIFPQGNVKILKKGVIDTLKNVSFSFPYKIFSNDKRNNFLYSFHNARVVIKNRFNYYAVLPKYLYPFGQQEISFDKVYSINAPKTISELKNMRTSDFDSIYSYADKITGAGYSLKLNRDFVYAGNGYIHLFANKKYPQFKGYVRIDTTCNPKKVPVNFFKLSVNYINPDTVEMPISFDYPSQHGNVETGLYWAVVRHGRKKIYTIRDPFIGRLKDAQTWSIFKPQGKIYYNQKAGEYRIADNREMLFSLRPDTISGNLMTYNKNLCLIRAQGDFNIFLNWDIAGNQKISNVKTYVRGYYRDNLFDNKESFQVAMGIDFIAPEQIMKSLADNILANPDNESIFEKKKERTIRNYNIYLGKNTTDKILNQIVNYFDYDLPPALKHTIMFSDVNLRYNADSSFLASKGKIGISNINGIKVDRYVKGYIKYRLHPKSRMLIIIIEPAPGIIYGFKYRFTDRGVMKFYTKTGDSDIDEYIANLKPRDKKFKNKYEISVSDENEFKSFAKEYFKKK